jgi:hypothetical protein
MLFDVLEKQLDLPSELFACISGHFWLCFFGYLSAALLILYQFLHFFFWSHLFHHLFN